MKHSATSMKRALKGSRLSVDRRSPEWLFRSADLGGSWLTVQERKWNARGGQSEYQIVAFRSGAKHWVSSGWTTLAAAVDFANDHDAPARKAWGVSESVTTTTANVATYRIPIGTRIDDFITRYGRKGDEKDQDGRKGSAVLSRVFPTG